MTSPEASRDRELASTLEARELAAFSQFLVTLRRTRGRPLTQREHDIAWLAFGWGYRDGIDDICAMAAEETTP